MASAFTRKSRKEFMYIRAFRSFLLLTVSLFVCGIAEATQIVPNSNYTVTGEFGFHIGRNDSNGNFVRDYWLAVHFGSGSTMQTGAVANGALSSLQLNLNGVVGGGLYSDSGQLLQTITGGNLQYNANNMLQSGSNPNIYGDVQGQSTAGALVFNVTTSGGLVLTTAMNPSYMGMGVFGDTSHVLYPGLSAFNNTTIGSIAGPIGQGSFSDVILHGWLMNSSVTIPNLGTYIVKGDFTARTSGAPIPEPATMGLLSAGLLGGAWRRRLRSKN